MPVSLTLFSPDEANSLIPFLDPRLSHLAARKRELDQVQNELEMMRLLSETGASSANPDLVAREGKDRRAKDLGEEIAEAVSAIHSKGCVVKDLDRGLVDFYSLRGDRIVFLCWQRGERRVAHWHPLSGGYSSRRPIQPKNT
jgi:hypothetical protein